MKVRHVKHDTITITISKETHQKLVALPFARNSISHAVSNEDGSISFAVPPHINDALRELHPDHDMAIQMLLGQKTN